MPKIRTIVADDEPLARERIRTLLAAEPDIALEAECASGDAALDAVRRLRPDLLFLDVQMPAMTGFEVLEALGPNLPATIFVTAYDKFAIKAFELHALDYLLKPFRDARFRDALERARKSIATHAQAEASRRILEMLDERPAGGPRRRIAVKTDSGTSFVPVDEIDWIESARNYVVLHAGASSHVVRENLGALEDSLGGAHFLRVSRFALVNLERVDRLEPGAKGETLLVLKAGPRVSSTLPAKELIERLQGL